MLTGDKVGTAKNIAAACNILPAEADVLDGLGDALQGAVRRLQRLRCVRR